MHFDSVLPGLSRLRIQCCFGGVTIDLTERMWQCLASNANFGPDKIAGFMVHFFTPGILHSVARMVHF